MTSCVSLRMNSTCWGVKIDVLVYDHDIAFSCAIFKVRRGVHADVDHAFRDLFVQLLRNFFRTEIIPAAFNCGRISNDPGFAVCKRRICRLMQQPERKENARADQQDEGK